MGDTSTNLGEARINDSINGEVTVFRAKLTSLARACKWYNFLGYIDSICVWYYILIIVQYTLETLFWLLTYMTVRRLIAVPAQANISSSVS